MSGSDPQSQSSNLSDIDEFFDVMSDESRRRVLYYLREHDGTADVAELRGHLSERTTADTAEISTTLHHRTLPKLVDCEVIDYDQNSEQVRYDGDPIVTELLNWIRNKEREDS